MAICYNSNRKLVSDPSSPHGPDITCVAAATAKLFQSCLTLCDLRDGSPPGSPIPGILQARVLEWGAIALSEHIASTYFKDYTFKFFV